MAKLPRHLLERAPEETVRRLCLSLLSEAARALERMEDPEDKEGLHDFRVSLRRLRSLMRAYRVQLKGSGAKQLRARVKTLASSTNLARDAEVAIEWLMGERERLGEAELAGASHLLSRLEAKQQTTPSVAQIRRAFRALEKNLKNALTRMRLPAKETSTTFVAATAEILAEHADILQKSLLAAHSAEDAELLHRARIEAKRMRYILEPLQSELLEARPLIKGMKSLQDCLGDLQDTRVLATEISEALESSALEEARKLRDLALRAEELPVAYPTQSTGLLALLRRQRERRNRCFEDLERKWIGPLGASYFERVSRFVGLLKIWPARELTKRRFLLAKLPASLSKKTGVGIREGWIPGNAIRERVRAVRMGRRVRYSRHVESNGDRPTEERLTRPAFERLWALTEGRQLECRRHELEDNGRVWTIVAIPSQELVLASIEAGAELILPEWIRSELLREITGVKKYEPEALARARAKSADRSR